MPSTLTRNVGSSFSSFFWQGQPIAFIDTLNDSGQQPITQYQAVTPLGSSYPVEFALPRVRTEGTLQIVLRELWNQPAWWALGQAAASTAKPAAGGGPFSQTFNIIEVYNVLAQTAKPITCTTVITIPNTTATPDPTSATGPGATYRGWTYHNVNLTAIDDTESIQIGSLTMPRTLQAVYAYKTYFSGSNYSGQNANSGNPGQNGPFVF